MKIILGWESFNEGYNKPRAGGKRRWSLKYKKKINTYRITNQVKVHPQLQIDI